MIGFNGLVPLVFLVVGQTPATPSNPEPGSEDPLFASHEMITLEIVGPIEDIREDRADEPEYRETVVHWTVGSDVGQVSARIRARGNFRKQKSTCRMPPLRVNFRKTEVAGTLFDGQDRLKLVTHCRNGDDYQQNVLEEFLAYRIYNLVTDQSFRARIAQITYQDPNEDEPLVRYGFFIEDEDRMALRLGGTMVEDFGQIHPYRFADGSEPQIALFQYMIGNTDFSTVSGHNVVVVRLDDGTLVPVPYDFDWSGMVNAGYARPNEQLGIRNVRQRVYRGFCRDGLDFLALYASFEALQPEVKTVIDGIVGWEDDERERAHEYLDDFFETMGDQGKANRQIARGCRQVA